MRGPHTKRFTDTEKWSDPWFRKLTLTHKLLWDFICSKCDIAGVWKPDFELASFFIGNDLSERSALDAFNGRIEVLPNGNWHIRKFICFQYGELSPDCRPHQAVLKLLREHGIGYPKGTDTLKDKDKDKDQDKDKDSTRNGHPSLEEVKTIASMSGIPESDAVEFWHHFEASGWIDKNGHPIVSWRSKLATWKTVARAMPLEAAHRSAEKPKTIWEMKTVLESKESLAADLKGKYCAEVAGGVHWSNEAKKKMYFDLRREIKDLKTRMSLL